MKKNWNARIRVILAITRKDLLDAIRNKNFLAVILPALFVVIMYRFLPAMLINDRKPMIRVVEPAQESILLTLEESENYRIRTYPDLEGLRTALANEERTEFGIHFPDNFQEVLAGGEGVELQGFVLEVFPERQVLAAVADLESELSHLFEQPIRLQLEGVSIGVESYGVTVLTSLALTFVVLMVGIVGLPHLMLEEKESKTLDAMLVSPASNVDIILAKGLTGMFYTVIVFGISTLAFYNVFSHWWLLAISGVFGSGIGIILGIGLGLLVESRQQLSIFAWVILVPLFIPMFLVVIDDLVPEIWVSLLSWLPSTALMRLIRTSMAVRISPEYFAPQLLCLALFIAAGVGVDTWLLRRYQR
jgi:ABC-2 type transport system permease protein